MHQTEKKFRMPKSRKEKFIRFFPVVEKRKLNCRRIKYKKEAWIGRSSNCRHKKIMKTTKWLQNVFYGGIRLWWDVVF